jgi:hypothetical protein
MGGRIWLLMLGLLLAAAGAVSGQNSGSSPTTEEATTPGGTATARDNSQSMAARPIEQSSPLDHPSEQSSPGTPLNHPSEQSSPGTPLNHPSEQSSPGTPLAPDGDNQKLREQILKVLRAHSSLASSSFDVEVSDSQIELSGSVPTAREKEIARRIAQSYGNNRSVADTKVGVRNSGGARSTQASQR